MVELTIIQLNDAPQMNVISDFQCASNEIKVNSHMLIVYRTQTKIIICRRPEFIPIVWPDKIHKYNERDNDLVWCDKNCISIFPIAGAAEN